MGFRESLHDWAYCLIVALVIVVLLFAFVGNLPTVNGSSMMPTLHDRERLLISRLGYTPSPGDIIMFTKPGALSDPNDPDRDAALVKRVIAVAGQTIYIDPQTGDVYVDGQMQDEPFIADKISPNRLGDWMPPDAPVTVPEGCVFVMGDNRNNSDDSRKSYVGMIDERYILGRVLLRCMPLNKFGTVS